MLYTKGMLSPNLPYYIVMFWALTAVGYCLIYFIPKRKTMNFVNIVMIVKFGKMIIYIGVLSIVYLSKIETDKMFVVSYLIIFVLYLIFDTITLYSLAKKSK
jgi:hypothetical protein